MEPDTVNFQSWVDKINSGKSTPEEELALAKYINSSMELALAFVRELKVVKAGETGNSQ